MKMLWPTVCRLSLRKVSRRDSRIIRADGVRIDRLLIVKSTYETSFKIKQQPPSKYRCSFDCIMKCDKVEFKVLK